MGIRMLLVVGATAALITATTALAAPDKTVTLSAATPEHAWDGEQGQYTNVEYSEETCSKDASTYCEQFLLQITSDTPVVLDASLTDFSSPLADFDLRIYQSDAAGTFGEQLESNTFGDDLAAPYWGGPNGFDEHYHVENVPAGFYLLVVSHYFNPGATYKGLVKVTGATGGAAAPAPADPAPGGGDPAPGGGDPAPTGPSSPAPAPAQAGPLPFKVPSTLGSARKAKKKKALRFRAVATEAITNLRISLIDKKKKVVGKASVASFPKGKKTLKLKVRKLKRGRYTLVSSGDVNGQNRVQTQAVKIKK